MTRRWVSKIAAIAALTVFLAGCAASFDHSIKEEGKSIVLISLQTVPDFEPNVWHGPVGNIYRFSPLFDEDDETFKGNRKAFDQSDDRQTLWLAFVLAPGTYSINGFVDQAETRDGIILFGAAPTRTTKLVDAGGPLTYDVGAGEIVYIGTFRSKLTTRNIESLGRKFVEAQKSYLLQTEEAKRIIQKLSLPEATYRQVNLFEGRPDARSLYERPITTIPVDE
tara:strand:+ start:126908 stop:127576 length:669 start_codon:yes stop_codon:yes gene_type:complete